jgi:hypothetical protein
LPLVPHCDIQTSTCKNNSEESQAFSEIQSDSAGFPAFRNVCQKSYHWKQRFINDSKTANIVVADESSAKRIFAGTVISDCVRLGLCFEENVVKVGYSVNQRKYKLFNEKTKLKTSEK